MKYCSVCKEKFDDSLSFCPADGEVLEEDPTSLLGTVLDSQYQIEGILGKGGMGAVYQARHILLGDRVAIKVLPPEMRSNTEWLRRFQREGQAARRFRHPNAVTVYDLRTSGDGMIYLVMEYVEGTTLDAELKRHGRFSPAEALVVLQPVMSVLNAAHAMGVVHRDLKPENVMIGKPSTGGEPVVKLLDLGIAKLREVAGAEKTGTTALTIAGQMLGTPYYMSPEQWGELPRDRNSDIDGRADIYSLGIVFYELIAGQRPFAGMTLSELRREHVSTMPRALHEFVPNVPAEYSRAIAKAIAKDRSDRQATAGELESELMTALAAEGITPAAMLPASVTAGASSSPTGTARRSITEAERTAPTIIGESVATGVESAAAAQNAIPPATIASQAGTMPTIVAAEREITEPRRAGAVVSTATMASLAPGVISPSVAPTAPRRSPLLFVGAGVVALLLVVGVGAFAVKQFMSSRGPTDPSTNSSAGGTDLSAGAHEIGRYWLEVNTHGGGDSIRASELIPMESKQEFKFHFSPSESGYLYIIGPGENNTPMTFLTAQPPAKSGVKTNEVKSGVDFMYPADTLKDESWITLNDTAGTDEFTVIFSTTPLSAPEFLAGPAGHDLTPQEQKQLADFRTEFKANAVGAEVITTGAFPSVSVKVPQTGEDGAPVIFKVRIEHK